MTAKKSIFTAAVLELLALCLVTVPSLAFANQPPATKDLQGRGKSRNLPHLK